MPPASSHDLHDRHSGKLKHSAKTPRVFSGSCYSCTVGTDMNRLTFAKKGDQSRTPFPVWPAKNKIAKPGRRNMSKCLSHLCCVVAALFVLALTGCGKKSGGDSASN